MTEHMYFKSRNIFPTLARGLFTEEIEEGDEVPPGLAGVELRDIVEEGSEEDETEEGAEGGGPCAKPRVRIVKERIVARGYDKFFNIEEVPWTFVSPIAKPS